MSKNTRITIALVRKHAAAGHPNWVLAKRILDGKASEADIASAERMVANGVKAAPALSFALGKAKAKAPAPKAEAKKAAPKKARKAKATPKVVEASTKASIRPTAAMLDAEVLDRLANSQPLTDEDVNRLGNIAWKAAFDIARPTVGGGWARAVGNHAKRLIVEGNHDLNAAVAEATKPEVIAQQLLLIKELAAAEA